MAALLGGQHQRHCTRDRLVFVPGFCSADTRPGHRRPGGELHRGGALPRRLHPNRIIRRHVLPNVAFPVIIQLFLALGLRPPRRGRPQLPRIGDDRPPSWAGCSRRDSASSTTHVGARLPGPGHHVDGPLVQLSGRRVARRAGRGAPRVKRQRGDGRKRSASAVLARAEIAREVSSTPTPSSK